ncbi:MAG: MBL fold metallo-hydrolase [Proteobacteria bacterium]|nr:MAG: MBL fold metallo-hydrolase [Pseudomonadota bacterium]
MTVMITPNSPTANNADQLRYPIEKSLEAGHYQAIVPGIYWLRMPLPIYLNHINLWLLEGESGFSIVDTGWATDENIAVWEKVEQQLFQKRPVQHIIATHMHPDHIGLAGWLTENYQTQLYMSRAEYLNCHLLLRYSHEQAPAEAIAFYRAAGYSEYQLQKYRAHFGQFGQFIRNLPHAYHRLIDQDQLTLGDQSWTIVVGHGHSPEHVCLYNAEQNIFIAGDQLLPTISSNVSVWPTEPYADPLQEWLASCERLLKLLNPDTLVLPAHGKPFYGAHLRLRHLIQEITDNLDKLTDFCREPRRVVDTFSVLFNSTITNTNLMMATGEGLAHLHYLKNQGLIEVSRENGVDYWRRH